MHDDETNQDERSLRSSTQVPASRIVDIEPLDVEAVGARRPGRRRERKPPRLGRDEAIQRLGGRRWLRPELALLMLGAVFVVAGLVKPWPNPVRTGSPSPIALASPAATLTESPSAALTTEPSSGASFPYVAPYNYRGPHGEQQPSATPPGITPSPTPPWSAVDWTALRAIDSHTAWGFATAAMPNGVSGPGGSVAYTSWIDAGTPPKYAAVFLPKGRNVYAIAITWPGSVPVSAVRFVYLGPPESPAYVPPDGYMPGAAVTPLPAGSVASEAPTRPPFIQISPPPTSGAIQSGCFWIPPLDPTSNPPSESITAAWQANPWPWPYGAYQVTVVSAQGNQNIVLDLEPTF